MELVYLEEVCPACGKLCLSERTAGVMIRTAKKVGSAKIIPKSKYFCKECGSFHLSHYGTANDNRTRRMPVYRRALNKRNIEKKWILMEV